MTDKVLIIAEAGVNHNGDIHLAKKLIDIAADAGADYVKFQTFIAENVVTRKGTKAAYQVTNTGSDESQLEMIKSFELKFDDFRELKIYAESKGIGFLSTAFDLESLRFLDELGLPIHKIPSGEITNLPYLRAIGALKKQVILSTGMATMDEIKKAIEVLVQSGTPRSSVSVLHCNTEYPTPFEDVNLNAMQQMREELGVDIGYSDHTPGIQVPVAAVALKAAVIEKHFTIDKNMKGPDHKASLEPAELKAMVESIRIVEQALGNGIKTPSPSEIKNMVIARRSIHIKNNIPKGTILKETDLIMKRPGSGISPMEMDNIVGRTTTKNLEEDHLLTREDLA